MEVLVLKLALLLTNLGIFAYLLLIVIQHYKFHYDRKSWAFLFHILTFLWLLIRGVFWLATLTSIMKWSSATFFVLYWMPTPLEFGAFLLLPLYFAHILYPAEWKKYWSYVRPLYFACTIGIFIFQSIWSLIYPVPRDKHCENVVDDYFMEECFRTEDSSTTFREITAVCFLFLAVVQCWFGVKVLKMDRHIYEQFLTTKPEVLSVVNVLLVISFASRSFYQLMAIDKLIILPDVPLQPSDGDVPFSILMACEIWIYLPTLLILLYFTSPIIGNHYQPKFDYYVPYYQVDTTRGRYQVDEDLDHESLLRDVPSRQGSFWQNSGSGSIPIEKPTKPESSEVVFPGSSFRSQSWLSEPDHSRYSKPSSLENRSRSQEREVSLLNHFRRYRQRGFSIGSDTSLDVSSRSVSQQQVLPPPSRKKENKVRNAYKNRKLRYYDEKSRSSLEMRSNSRSNSTVEPIEESLKTRSSNDLRNSGEEGSEDEGEREEEFDIIVDTAHGGMTSGSHSKQYELMVEPPSPSPPTAINTGSYIQESGYYLNRGSSFTGIESIRVSSYEASGGDHVHGNHNNIAHIAGVMPTIREVRENNISTLDYNHDRSDSMEDSNLSLTEEKYHNPFMDPFAVNPIYPRPTRHHSRVNHHLFHGSESSGSNNNSPKITEQRVDIGSSFSPQLIERIRSADNNSTPDRDEAALETTRIRQNLKKPRYSPP